MANGYSKYDIVEGIAAALGGRVPQFEERMKNRREQTEMALYQDAQAALNMAQRGDFQGILDLTQDRMDILGRMGIPSDETKAAGILAQGAIQGDPDSAKKLIDGLRNTVQKGIDLGRLARPAAPERITVGEGQIVYERNPITGEFSPVVSGGEKKQSRTPTTELGKLRSDLDSNAITQTQYDEQVALINKREDRATFEEESKLRREFNTIPQVKSFSEQSQAYGRIAASALDPSPAGDLALIFNYMKVLDPGSTVREGEFANAQNAGSVPSRIAALYNNVIEGTRLTETQRQDFVNRAEGLYKDAESGFMKRYNQYIALAKDQNLDPNNILSDYRYNFESPETQQQNTFATKRDFDSALPNLPPGLYSYIDVKQDGQPELVTVEVGE